MYVWRADADCRECDTPQSHQNNRKYDRFEKHLSSLTAERLLKKVKKKITTKDKTNDGRHTVLYKHFLIQCQSNVKFIWSGLFAVPIKRTKFKYFSTDK